jgi:hypothetical protein
MNITAKRITHILAIAAMFVVCDLSIVNADTETQPSAVGQMASNLNPMNWRMPQWKKPSFKAMLPAKDEQAQLKKKKDGLFSEVGKTASNSWTRTKEVLSPTNFFTASARKPEPEPEEEPKPGFFHSLFNPTPEEEQEDATVTDFLSKSRPTP